MYLEPIVEQDLPAMDKWYDDKESHYFAKATKEWLGYVQRNSKAFAWKLIVDNQMVGIIHVDRDGLIGYPGFIISPSHRRKGYGLSMLNLVLEQEELSGIGCLVSTVRPENEASLELLAKAGYIGDIDILDEDGMITFKKVIA